MRYFLWFLAALLTLASCSREKPGGAITSTSGEVEWSSGPEVAPSPEIATALTTITQATVHRITGEFNTDWQEHKDAPKISGYPSWASSRLSAAGALEIGTILSNKRNYLRENETWTCLPQPVYLIRFTSANGSGEIVVHECGDVEISFIASGPQAAWAHGLKASPAEQRLWALLRQPFPETAPERTGTKQAPN